MSGVRFEDRYRMVRMLGSGSFGEVRVARDIFLQREVALKIIHANYANDHRVVERFMTEAEMLADLEHPHIIPIHDSGRLSDGRPFFSMRLVEGSTLESLAIDFHTENRRTPAAKKFSSPEFIRLVQYLRNAANAIEFAHRQCVVHRDIKPGNILISHHHETFVVDWGTAKNAQRSRSNRSTDSKELIDHLPEVGQTLRPEKNTVYGMILGTPAFMSPEQAAGRNEAVSEKSDIYSLGATLYFILAGFPPHHGAKLKDVLAHAQKGEVVDVRQHSPNVPDRLVEICKRSLQPNPNDRYDSASELLHDLELFLDECTGPPLPPPVQVGDALKPSHSNSSSMTWKLISLGLAGLLVAISSVSGIHQLQLHRQLDQANRSLDRHLKEKDQSFESTTVSRSVNSDESAQDADQETIEQLQQELDAFNRERESHSVLLSDRQSQIDQYESQIAHQLDELETLQLQVDTSESQLQRLVQENESLIVDRDQLELQLADVEQQRQQSDQASTDWDSEQQVLLDRIDSLKESIEEARQLADSERERAAELEVQLSQLVAQVEMSDEELSDNERLLIDLNDRIEVAERKNDEMESRLNQLSTQSERFELEAQTYREQFDAAKQRNEELVGELAALQEQLGTVEEQLANAQQANQSNGSDQGIVSAEPTEQSSNSLGDKQPLVTQFEVDELVQILENTPFRPTGETTQTSLTLVDVFPNRLCQLAVDWSGSLVICVNTQRDHDSLAQLNHWNGSGHGMTAYHDHRGRTILEARLPTSGGITEWDVVDFVAWFHRKSLEFEQQHESAR